MRRLWLAILAVVALAACGAPPATTSPDRNERGSLNPDASASGSQASPTTTLERPSPIGEEPELPGAAGPLADRWPRRSVPRYATRTRSTTR